MADLKAGSRPVVLLLVAGFALRVATIFWALPLSPDSGFFHADEVKSWGSTVDFPGNYLTSQNYLYGTAVQYSVGVLLLPVRAMMDSDEPQRHERYRLIAILVFRFCNILMSTAAIWLVYCLGMRLADRTTGVTAAAMTCVATGHVLDSSLCTLDVPMSFLLLSGLLLAFRAVETGRRRDFVLTGIAAGLLAGTKFTGAFFVGVPFLLVLLRSRFIESSSVLRPVPATRLWTELVMVFLPMTATVFAVSTPHVVLSPGEYIQFMLQQKHNWYDRVDATLLSIVQTWFRSTSAAIGPIAAALAGLGLLTGIRRFRLPTLITALFVLAYYIFWRDYLCSNFVSFVIPLLSLFVAMFCVRLLGKSRQSIRFAGRTAIVVGIAWPLVFTASGIVARLTDARSQASRFIAENIATGSTIGVASDSHDYNWRHHQWRYPPIDWNRFQERDFLSEPEVIVVTSYEVDVMAAALQSDSMLAGFVWNPEHRKEWYKWTPPSPRVFEFYSRLLSGRSYTPLRRFQHRLTPDVGSIAPTVWVYRRIAHTVEPGLNRKPDEI
jgi:hypothetical protein